MKKLFLFLFTCCFMNHVVPQTVNEAENFNLYKTHRGNVIYRAKEYIKLSPGFLYTADSSNTLVATADQRLLFPPDDATYLTPDGIVTPSPILGGVVGNISGSLNVGQTGAANYTIPIECPEGVNGMTPQVYLTYNSQGGDGLVGLGWNIGGLSAISKTPKTIYFDNESSYFVWDNFTTLTLDGVRLLTSDSVYYYTENDPSLKITRYNDTEYGESFKVENKNGITSYYTNREYLQERTLFDWDANTFSSWRISKQENKNGAYIKYEYDFDYRSILLKTVKNNRVSKITYGHNNYGDVGTIEFTYKNKIKDIVGFISQKKYVLDQILESIEVTGTNINTPLRTYTLNYKLDGELELLETINLNNDKGEKYNPLTFGWGVDNTSITIDRTSFTLPYTTLVEEGSDHWYSADYNADGLSDLIYIYKINRPLDNKIASFFPAYINEEGNVEFEYSYQNTIELPIADFAMVDLKTRYSGALSPCNFQINSTPHIFIPELHDQSGETHFLFHDINLNHRPITSITGFILKTPTTTMPLYNYADLNNDGFDDIIIIEKIAINGNYPCSIIYGNTQFDIGIPEFTFSNLNHDPKKLFCNDYNADGLIDIMLVNEDGYHLYKNTGSDYSYEYSSQGLYQASFSYITSSNENNEFYCNESHNIIREGDFNGDGLIDFLVNKDNLDEWSFAINEGDWDFNMIALPQITAVEEGNTSSNDTRDQCVVYDFNNDGKSDIFIFESDFRFGFNGSYAAWYQSTGQGVTEINRFTTTDIDYSFGRNTCLGDFNGDGKADLMSYKSQLYGSALKDDNFHLHHSFDSNHDFKKITAVTNSFGKRDEITYKPLTHPNIYTNQHTLSEQIKSVEPAFFVVDRLTKDVGTNSEFLLDYTYTDALFHTQRKGFLGFRSISAKNTSSNIIQQSNSTLINLLGVPFALVNTSTTTELDGGNSIKSTVQDFTFEQVNGKRYFPKLNWVEETDKLTGISLKTSYSSYDDYGNPETILKEFLNTDIEEEQNIVYTTAGAWCPNKPQSVTVIKSNGSAPNQTRVAQYLYDSNGNPTRETKDPGDVNQLITNYNSYDAFGNPQQIQSIWNGISRSTSYTYSSCGRFVTTKTDDYTSFATNYSYDGNTGLLLSETDHQSRETTYEYDSFGRLIRTNYPDGIISVKAHQWANGNGPSGAEYYIYTETSGESPVWTWHDILGREMRTESYGLDESTKICVDTEYDSKGRLYRTSEPYFSGDSPTWAVTNSYDDYNRITSQQTTMGTVTTSYEGLETTITSPDGTRTTTVNAAGETVTSTVNGKSVSYTYHSSGLTKTATPEGGIALSMEYDLQGNRTELVDPDAGTITSLYNGFGELVWEKQDIHDADDQITTNYTYLPNGLLSSINRNGETTNYTYDANYRIESIAIANQHSQTFGYDSFDRVTSMSENIQGDVFNTSTTYDDFGRVKEETYPSGFYITNTYSGYGYLTEIKDDDGNSIWKAEAANAFGQLTQTSYGNSQSKIFGFNSKHQPISIVAGNAINHTYAFNDEGNLLYRQDNLTNQKEEFFYDTQNRLEYWDLYKSGALARSDTIQFDGMGNITKKSDIGFSMNYNDTNHPHAISSISGNPQNIPDETQSITYTDFKKIATIKEGTDSLNIVYGVDDQRRKTTFTNNGTTVLTRYYLGNYEVEVDNVGNQRKLHYISGGNGIAAIHVIEDTGDTTYFTHTDYLGSLTSLTDANGTLVEKYAYGPWGIRRNPTDWELTDSRASLIFDRGYTGHEHLDNFGLINMNGRVYDPLLASFLSPDPYVQAPSNWVNYNRYGYALNNPLLYNDPDGEFIVPMLIGAGIATLTNGLTNIAYGQDFFHGAGKAAFWGAIGGAVSFGIGEAASSLGSPIAQGGAGWSKLAVSSFQIGAHAITGGFTSVAQGGDFLTGFATGGIASGLGSASEALKLGEAGIFVSGFIGGGIGAELAGGDFLVGAGQGMLTSTLNHSIHSGGFGGGLAAAAITGKWRHLWKPDAVLHTISVNGTAGINVGIEGGVIEVTRGDEKGFYSAFDISGGLGGLDVSLTYEQTRLYYSGKAQNIKASTFYGPRLEGNVSIGVILSVGINFSVSFIDNNNEFVLGMGPSIGIGVSATALAFNLNYGVTAKNPAQARKIINKMIYGDK